MNTYLSKGFFEPLPISDPIPWLIKAGNKKYEEEQDSESFTYQIDAKELVAAPDPIGGLSTEL